MNLTHLVLGEGDVAKSYLVSDETPQWGDWVICGDTAPQRWYPDVPDCDCLRVWAQFQPELEGVPVFSFSDAVNWTV